MSDKPTRLSILFLLFAFCGPAFPEQPKEKPACEVDEIVFKPQRHTTDGNQAECETFYYWACQAAERELRDKCTKACERFEKLPFTDAHTKCGPIFKAAIPGFEKSVCGDEKNTHFTCEVSAKCTCDP